MKKKLLVAAAVALVLVVGFVGFASATQPDTFRIERSISISAPPEAVFAQVSDFKAWAQWNPFEKGMPNVEKTYEGAPATVGSSYHYKGEEIGEGHMVFKELKAPNSVVVDLEFIKPFAAKNDAIFTFEPDGAGTRATWAMTGANSTLGKCMSVFFDADVMIGGEFEKGLADLKAAAEASKPAQAVGN